MDQKTFLAVILSLCVWIGYGILFTSPKRPQSIQTNSATNQISTYPEAKTAAPKTREKTTNIDFKAVDLDFNSTAFHSNLTNVGGSLHNIQIDQKHEMPLGEILSIKGTEDFEFNLAEANGDVKTYEYSGNGWSIRKVFTFNDDRTVKVRMEINNSKDPSRLENIKFILFKIDLNRIDLTKHRETMLDEYSFYIDKNLNRKNGVSKFDDKQNKSLMGQVHWAGFRDHFSVFVVKPQFKTEMLDIAALSEKELEISVQPQKSDIEKSGGVFEFTFYAGPQDIDTMKKYKEGYEKIVAFMSFGPLDFIAKTIHHTIPLLHKVTGSWGGSIILLGILLYALTYPLTFASMKAMRKLQVLQPRIKAIQEKYKNDPKRMNTEVMEIYKREKANPLGGCLPMLLQMPIFITLYQALWRSYYFQGKSFLWIKDLSMPDRLFTLPFTLPVLGNAFNILPILMAAAMFAQQKIASKNAIVTDEQQAAQQKMMMYIMPIFLAFIFYNFASGLTLYFTVSYLLSAVTQLKVNKLK